MNLKHPVAFFKNISTTPLEEENWQLIHKTFAHITSLHSNNLGLIDNFDFGQVVTAHFFLVTIRSRDNIVLGVRMRYNNRSFEIKKIIENFENKKFLKIIMLEL